MRTELIRFNLVNIIIADALATQGKHRHPYWLCRIGKFLSYLTKNFNYLNHVNVDEWHKMWIYVFVPSEKFTTSRFKIQVDDKLKISRKFSAVNPERMTSHQEVLIPITDEFIVNCTT